MNISELYKKFRDCNGICTDSRNIIKDSLFFSLKGDNFNGNEYAKQAIKEGCKLAIIDDDEFHSGNCILVENVKNTLQELAKYHRNQLNIPIIGITGTNGKTTTKELINSVLSTQYNCYFTKGNLNNQIGLPLSVLEIEEAHEIAVIEMGASEIGEIENLCNISEPTSGVITNIGKAHLEGFGSFQGVIKAKTELYTFLKESNGTTFVNSADKLLVKQSSENIVVTCGISENSDFNFKVIETFPFITIKLNDEIIKSNLIGKFQIDNIATVACIGNFYNISNKNIKLGIENYKPKNNRTEIVETEKNFIILDAYNANPSSMNSMIDSFAELKKDDKLCILGEMRELGSYSEEEHELLVQKMKTLNIESIFVGKEFENTTNSNSFKNTEDLINNLLKFQLKNRTILIKGSRGIALEKLIKFL